MLVNLLKTSVQARSNLMVHELDRAVVWGAKYKFNDAVNASYYGTDIKDRLERHYVNANYSYALANGSTLTHDFQWLSY